MKLLFLSNLYPPLDMGGYEQWCQEVATRMQQRGHEILVLTSRYGLDTNQPAEQNVDRTLYLQADVHFYRPLDFFFRRPSQKRSNRRELRRAIDQFSPDLIVIWGMWDLSRDLPRWAEQWMPNRVVYFVSSYWPMDTDIHIEYWQLPAERPLTELFKRPLRHLALSQLRREGYPPQLRFEHVRCCSHYVRETLIEAGTLPASAGVLYGGTDLEPFVRRTPLPKKEPGDPLRLLYFGSLLPHKGVHVAIEAMGQLKQQGLAEKAKLTILGGGHPDYEARLRKLAAQLGVDEQIHFAGRVPRDQVPTWLQRSDVFLFTSTWAEPMARSVMEAMAAGLLVVGTEVGGQTEMLSNNETGLTFQAEDTDALTAHIVRVIEDPALRHRLAQAGQQMVSEQFTLDRMVTDLENWLQSIV